MENSSDEILKSLESRKTELDKRVAELRSSEDELKRVSAAIAALSVDKPIKTRNGAYNPDLGWADKVKYVLKQLGRGGVAKVVQYIEDHESGSDHKHVYQSVAQIVNKLAGAGELKYERVGRGFIYWLAN
jgi:hypothetical protein